MRQAISHFRVDPLASHVGYGELNRLKLGVYVFVEGFMVCNKPLRGRYRCGYTPLSHALKDKGIKLRGTAPLHVFRRNDQQLRARLFGRLTGYVLSVGLLNELEVFAYSGPLIDLPYTDPQVDLIPVDRGVRVISADYNVVSLRHLDPSHTIAVRPPLGGGLVATPPHRWVVLPGHPVTGDTGAGCLAVHPHR